MPEFSFSAPPAPETGAWTPTDMGLLAWSYDPATTNQVFQPTAGVQHYTRIKVGKALTISNVKLQIAVASSSEDANCFVSVYSIGGTRLGVSADQSVGFRSAGEKTVAITVDSEKSLSIAERSEFWVGLLMGTQGTTPGKFGCGASSGVSANLGTSGATLRSGSAGSGLTAAPASFTPSSLAAVQGPILYGIT
jgi:hypothetical protein